MQNIPAAASRQAPILPPTQGLHLGPTSTAPRQANCDAAPRTLQTAELAPCPLGAALSCHPSCKTGAPPHCPPEKGSQEQPLAESLRASVLLLQVGCRSLPTHAGRGEALQAPRTTLRVGLVLVRVIVMLAWRVLILPPAPAAPGPWTPFQGVAPGGLFRLCSGAAVAVGAGGPRLLLDGGPFLLLAHHEGGAGPPRVAVLRVALEGEAQLAVLRGDEAAGPSALLRLLQLQVLQAQLLLAEPTEAPPAEGGVLLHQAGDPVTGPLFFLESRDTPQFPFSCESSALLRQQQ